MKKDEFVAWLKENDVSKKMQSDMPSRLKKLESVTHLDIDKEYRKDRCQYLLSLFNKSGKNEEMKKLNATGLPIGKYYLSTYKFALKKYVDFNDQEKNK